MFLGVTLIFAGIMPFTARSVFNVFPGAINTVSQGVLVEPDHKAEWIMCSSLTSGDKDNSHPFYSRFLQETRMFDRNFFTREPGNEVYSIFVRMCLIIFTSCVVFLYLLFMDVRLTIVSLLPVFFSLVCTLGVLKLAGQSLNVAGLMLVFSLPGMSIYGSFLMGRSYQRHQSLAPPFLPRKRLAIFIGSAAMIVGFVSLFTADHNLLKGAGSLIPVGIGLAMAGAFVMLPFLLDWFYGQASRKTCSSENLWDRVTWRYRNMDIYPRFFALFKIRLDPMFSELPGLVEGMLPVRTIIDIGTGYGVPAAWFLEKFPGVRIFGLDPDKDRIRVAALAARDRGEMAVGRAPEVPSPPEPAELATLLDVIQYLDDDALEQTLRRLADKLCPKGMVILRIAVPLEKGNPWPWWIEHIRVKAKRITTYYRSVSRTEEMLREAGFAIQYTGPSGKNGDLFWLVGTIKKDHPLP